MTNLIKIAKMAGVMDEADHAYSIRKSQLFIQMNQRFYN